LWLGPAPYHAFNHNRVQATFRYFWDYAGGTMTDWGVHLLDVVHWAMGVEAPNTVAATGGKYVVNDNRATPDTFEVLYEYPQSKVSGSAFLVRWAHRTENAHAGDGRWYGIQFYGTQGTLFVDRGGYTLWPEEDRKDPWGLEAVKSTNVVQGEGTRQHYPHVLNFLECLRTRQKPHSDIETAHRSTTAAHLGNIALRTGRKLRWDAAREQFPDDADANKMLTRGEYRKPWVVA
jgi:predicted dehydrogenase